jgi:hypothetical protein
MLQFGAHTRESKHVTALKEKRRAEAERNKRKVRADGFFHPFVLVFSRRTIALHGSFRDRCFPGLRPIPSICTVGRRFFPATGIVRKSHPLFPRELKIDPLQKYTPLFV